MITQFPVSREEIYATLFSIITTKVSDFKTASRRVKLWNEVQGSDQPALFMSQKRESSMPSTKLPTKWIRHVDLIIYAQAGADTDATKTGRDAPATVLNNLIDQVEKAIAPLPGQEEQTLGGRVHYCRIEGDIITDEGALGDQAVAIIPVTICIPQFRL